MLTQCCVCRKTRVEDEWRDVPAAELLLHDVSHGYCPDCAITAFEELHFALDALERAAGAAAQRVSVRRAV